MRLGDLCRIKLNDPEADFWITRRGSNATVGKPVKEFNAEHIGVKVLRTDILLPQFLFYAIDHLYRQHYFAAVAHGTLPLVNIKVGDVKAIKLAPTS